VEEPPKGTIFSTRGEDGRCQLFGQNMTQQAIGLFKKWIIGQIRKILPVRAKVS